MGKRYSLANVGQRNRNDYYQTPFGITWEFYEKYKYYLIGKKILEPFAGNGAIVKALLDKDPKFTILSSDITEGVDFFDINFKSDVIVSNPPYKNTLSVIKKCLDIAENTFLLMPIAHLSGQNRYVSNIYKDCLISVDILSRMPMFSKELREDGKFKTGMMVVGWYHFTKNKLKSSDPLIKFTDVQKYVFSSRG